MTRNTPTVLVVADYAPSRYAFRRILAGGSYAVVEATDAASATAQPVEGIDLALVDVNLPDGSGFDVSRHLIGLRPDLPVILVSASYRAAEEDDVWRESGARAFFEQPIDAAELLAKVRELLGEE